MSKESELLEKTVEKMPTKKAIGDKKYILALVVIVGSFVLLGIVLVGMFYKASTFKEVSESQVVMAIISGILGVGIGTVTSAVFGSAFKD